MWGGAGEYSLVYRDTIYEKLVLSGGQCEEDRAIQFRLYSYNIVAGEYAMSNSMYDYTLVNDHFAYYRAGSMIWTTDSLRKGYCHLIKFDTINNIASGTFEFEAYNAKDSTTIIITDGRFDIHFDNFK